MSSGVRGSDEVVSEFQKLKYRKINYEICRLLDDFNMIIVDRGGKVASYEEFVELLPTDASRPNNSVLGICSARRR